MPETSNDIPKRRVLIVEDEPSIRELLHLHLALAGYDVDETADGAQALTLVRDTKFDLIVLDVLLPGLDGITLCRAIRSAGINAGAGILMVTARGSESDKVLGLESGADDYLTKPFGIREMLARAAAILRRNARLEEQPDLAAATRSVKSRDVTLDADRRQAVVRGESVTLTRQEFDLLYLLAARPGIVFSRTALLSKVWNGDSEVTERTVDTVVSRLRRKIQRGSQVALIQTSWGVGYKFADAD
jgi:DNA-binding response OmpR family regulator